MTGSDESGQDGIGSPSMSPAQSRAARALLGWSEGDLAAKVGLGEGDVHGFEEGFADPPSGQVEALRSALMKEGILFSESDGVSLSRRGRDEGTRADALTTENDR